MSLINKITVGTTDYNIADSAYYTCGTAAATANKSISGLSTAEIVDGLSIKVKFTYGNTVANPKLYVGSTGYTIYKYGTTAPGTTGNTSWYDGEVVEFTFVTSGSTFVAMMTGGTSNFSGSYNDLTNKPTIPATNVIPATTTANKALLSTTTSGTAKWSDFNTAGFLKTNASGVISVDGTSYLSTNGGTISNNLTVNGYLITSQITPPDEGENDTITITGEKLLIYNTSIFRGDTFVGEWVLSNNTWMPGQSQNSLRVNGTFETNGEINTRGHSINCGAINCDEIEAGNSTVYCGNIYCGEINGSTASLGGTSVSSLSVSGTSSLSGNITCSGTFNGYDASYSGSVTVNGTLRANNDLKTSSVYPSESDKKNLGKSNYLYRHSYITEMHTDKITSLTNTETYTDPTTGEPATRNVFVTMPLASGVITTDESLATVAKTGSYNDLTNKPTIPTYTAGTGLTLSSNQFSVSSANASTILNLLSTGSSTPTDDDYYISQYVGGGTTTTTYHRRPMSALYTYIKGKTDSLYLGKTAQAADSAKLGGVAASNYIQTSSTAGLVKNDGTIDTTAYTSNTGTVTSVAIANDTNGGLTVSSGSPITTSGTIKLKHSNVLSSSGTIGSSSASSGATLAVPYANYDINGHITSKGTHTHTIDNLTSSAINSSYKLPTTTEWAGKQNTLSSTNKLSSSYISWDGNIDLSNDPEGFRLTNVGGYESSNGDFSIDVDGWLYYTNGNPMSIQETHNSKTITLLTDTEEVRTKNTAYTFKEDGLYLDTTKVTHALGTTSTTAAAGNHAHTLSLTSGGTSTVNLSANTSYTLTAGGNSLVFKTPAAGGSVKVDGITSSNSTITRYASCSTASGTKAKTASITNGTFTLETGARVTVYFQYKNTVANPTLNINNTGAKSLLFRDGKYFNKYTATALHGMIDLIYNGSAWYVVSPGLVAQGTFSWNGSYSDLYDEIIDRYPTASFTYYVDNSDDDYEDYQYYPCMISAKLYYDGTSNTYTGFVKYFTGTSWANVNNGSTICYTITL